MRNRGLFTKWPEAVEDAIWHRGWALGTSLVYSPKVAVSLNVDRKRYTADTVNNLRELLDAMPNKRARGMVLDVVRHGVTYERAKNRRQS